MSTASLPPERRSEIARAARSKQSGQNGGGRKPCHETHNQECKRCRARASEYRSRAAKGGHNAVHAV